MLDDQGDDVSSHADTIRAALVAPMPGGWGANDPEVALNELLAENRRLRDALDKGREFVATTSYFRQRKESRPEFEAFAFALLDLREALAGEGDD